MSKYRNYTEEDISAAVLNSTSIAGVLRHLDLVPIGGNYATIKKRIAQLGLDTSHFSGAAWMPKGWHIKTFDNLTNPTAIKKRLIQERSHSCESCQLQEWLGKPIVLEMDHVDGDRNNNQRSNLRLLCPNCHSQTQTWRKRKSALD
jgi:RNA polymerase subunit RPABC4/transcription elongation factor Spt4